MIKRAGYAGKQILWECQCSCFLNSIVYVRGADLKSKKIQSCGCIRKEKCAQEGKKYNSQPNNFILHEEENYVEGFDNFNSFLIDLEDYAQVSKYNWHLNKGYWYNKKLKLSLQNFVMPHKEGYIVDHIYRNKNDNRKINLRYATQKDNTKNRSISCNNTTGVNGVDYCKKFNKWRARITVNNKILHLGYFLSLEEAKKERRKAEEKYFGEFSPKEYTN